MNLVQIFGFFGFFGFSTGPTPLQPSRVFFWFLQLLCTGAGWSRAWPVRLSPMSVTTAILGIQTVHISKKVTEVLWMVSHCGQEASFSYT